MECDLKFTFLNCKAKLATYLALFTTVIVFISLAMTKQVSLAQVIGITLVYFIMSWVSYLIMLWLIALFL